MVMDGEADELPIGKIEVFFSKIFGKPCPNLIWTCKDYFHEFGRKFKKDPVSLNLPGLARWISYNQEKRRDIFFSLTPHGSKVDKASGKKAWTKKLKTCLLVDLDCGTDNPAVKLECLKSADRVWMKYGIDPNVIVRSRHGFHLYWTFTQGIDEQVWQAAQGRLAIEFGGDTSIVDPKQSMRLPFTMNFKGA
jgi:RepB DNA-primase from phage plasmid